MVGKGRRNLKGPSRKTIVYLSARRSQIPLNSPRPPILYPPVSSRPKRVNLYLFRSSASCTPWGYTRSRASQGCVSKVSFETSKRMSVDATFTCSEALLRNRLPEAPLHVLHGVIREAELRTGSFRRRPSERGKGNNSEKSQSPAVLQCIKSNPVSITPESPSPPGCQSSVWPLEAGS